MLQPAASSAMPRSLSLPTPLLCALLTLAALALSSTPALAGLYPGDVAVAPNPGLRTLDGLDIAPDGSGAMVFTRDDGGVDHVFVSRLVDGAWSGPERVDDGLGAASSEATVAAGDGGRVIVAFVNGGNVYAVTRAGAGTGYVRQTVWSGGGASGPAVDASVNGKAYLAFAAPGAGGHDVRSAFAKDAGAWTVAAAPLDANAGNDAGVGTGRARVAASADGVAIVVWGEGGHVFARRVFGTAPSLAIADALEGLAIEGVPAASADTPVVSTQDDDSFTGVAFRAHFNLGGPTLRSRAVFRRLRGSRFETPTTIDNAPFASGQSSGEPRLATVGTGQGIAVAQNDTSFLNTSMRLLFDVEAGPLEQPDSIAPSTAPTFAVVAAATVRKMIVAWQYTPAAGAPEIHARYFAETAFEPEQAISRAELGPTLAARGLHAAADDNGDIAVAYVQDVPGQGPAIAVATVDQPPARFSPIALAGFQRTDRPTLSWTTSREAWGRHFQVTIDGVVAGVTGRRSFRVPTPLAQGAHTWQVTSLDRRGQGFPARTVGVRIDSRPATARARLSGARRAGASLRLRVTASDAPAAVPGVAPVVTSGVKSIVVDWGDKTARQRIRRGGQHVYARPGRYALRVLVTDRAGNRTTVLQRLKIAKPAKGGTTPAKGEQKPAR